MNYEANFIPVNAAGTLFIGVYYTDISSNFVLFSHVLYRYEYYIIYINESIALFAVFSATALLFIYIDTIIEGWWGKINVLACLTDHRNAVCVEAQFYKCNIQMAVKCLFF